MPVVIHGGSERSNGLQVGTGSKSSDSIDFLFDSSLKYEQALRKYGISCSFSLAYEHYSKARKSQGRISSKISRLISMILAEILCDIRDHHSNNWIVLKLHKVLLPMYNFTFKTVRKAWQIRNFGFRLPVKNQKYLQADDMNVVLLSKLIKA
jgi:hypothetical protein